MITLTWRGRNPLFDRFADASLAKWAWWNRSVRPPDCRLRWGEYTFFHAGTQRRAQNFLFWCNWCILKISGPQMFLTIHHIAPEKWFILKGAKISKSFFLKSDARFRFLVINHVWYYIFFLQNHVLKLKKCKKPQKRPSFLKIFIFGGFFPFFHLKTKFWWKKF